MHTQISDAVLSGLQFGTKVAQPLLLVSALGRQRGSLRGGIGRDSITWHWTGLTTRHRYLRASTYSQFVRYSGFWRVSPNTFIDMACVYLISPLVSTYYLPDILDRNYDILYALDRTPAA